VKLRYLLGSALLVVLSAACASGGGGTPRNDTPMQGALVADYTNIHLALQELRPSWTRRVREVFIDGNYAGPVGVLQRSFNERIQIIELVPAREVTRRFGPCQAPAGTGSRSMRDPQCGTRPVIHIVRYSGS
jgi:hypothetical protein